jgi:hypothetical protein
MNHPAKILLRSFVRPFYRENAGSFIFVFIMLFYIVGEDDGAGLIEYHYSLIMGMLTSKIILLLVFFLWLLYAGKYTAFVAKILKDPRYSFMQIYNCLDKGRQFRLFVMIEVLLLLPVLLYSVFIVAIGFHHHFYLTVLLIIVYLLLLGILPALWHVHCLSNNYKRINFPWQKIKRWPGLPSFYPVILIRFVVRKQKMIWLGVKVFTCGILYLIAGNNKLTPSDIGTVFLFFNFGILGNGIILYRIREFEETQLRFYRGAPVSLLKRFLQYSLVYFIFLIPEFITAAILAPVYLSYSDAINFTLCGYSLLLVMNTITFLQDFSMRDYLKIILLVFSVQYIFIVTGMLGFLYLFFFVLALALFLISYYRFERNM